MLVEVVEHVRRAGGRPQMLYGKLFGQEKNVTTAAIARMNLILHGVEDFRVVREDTLRNPAFFTGGRLAQFDCVIANPPFSLKKWGREQWESDPYARNRTGIPPESYADWAWVQHMVTSMVPITGRVAVVLPQGALFRGGAEGRIRAKMLEADTIEAVVGLGPNLFYGATLAPCIMVLRDKKRAERAGKVLVVDASDLFKKGRNQNTLEPEHIEAIERAVNAFADEPGRSHLATWEEIKANDGNLNISLYVQSAAEDNVPTLDEALAELEAVHAEVLAAEQNLKVHLAEWGLL
jgi:type I restriction enzyme M protein